MQKINNSLLMPLNPAYLAEYLAAVVGGPVQLLSVSPLGEPVIEGSLEVKEYGYGRTLLIEYESLGRRHRVALHTIKPGPFGHERMDDRAADLLWSRHAFNSLPRHIRSIDAGAFDCQMRLHSVGGFQEFFLLTQFVPGREYALDLARIVQEGSLSHGDLARADALCDYLVGIHQVRGGEPTLYTRRIRELVGHGECIMGLTDSYPAGHPVFPTGFLESVEKLAVEWRWRIKGMGHRLRQVHGDFHPWNILFQDGTEFTVLDRSRGEWGEPADDVTSLTMNYLFQAIQTRERVEGPCGELFRHFWKRYLDRSGDAEVLDVAPPFIAFRALVMASPVWYPHLPDAVCVRLRRLIESVLSAKSFDPERVDEYLHG